jgi:hypothetical protein
MPDDLAALCRQCVWCKLQLKGSWDRKVSRDDQLGAASRDVRDLTLMQ